MDTTDRHPTGRRPVDSETIIALLFLAVALLFFGGFGLMVLSGMLSLEGH